MTNQTHKKATFLPRLFAWMIDAWFMMIIIFASIAIFSNVLKIDSYSEKFSSYYSYYGELYDLDLDLSEEEYSTLSESELARYDEAYAALTADPEAAKVYNSLTRRTLASVELSFLLAYLVIDFLLPLLLKNGQTIGKRLMKIAVVRTNGEPANIWTLLSRTVLGRFLIETLVPVSVVTSLFMGSLNLIGIIFVIVLLIANIVLLFKKNTQLHDRLADTMVVMRSSGPSRQTTPENIAKKAKLSSSNTGHHS